MYLRAVAVAVAVSPVWQQQEQPLLAKRCTFGFFQLSEGELFKQLMKDTKTRGRERTIILTFCKKTHRKRERERERWRGRR